MSTTYFRWTDRQKEIFADQVSKYKGHLKNEETMEVKWKRINEKLVGKAEFSGLNVTWQSLQNQYKRFSEATLKEIGISVEGANLSGLPENASNYVQYIVAMAKEKINTEAAKKTELLKKKRKAQALLTHESRELQHQGQLNSSISSSSDYNSSEESSSTNRSCPAKKPTIFETLQEQFETIKESIEDKDTKLLKNAYEARLLAIQEQQIEFQRAQLEFQREQLEVQKDANEIRKMELQVILNSNKKENQLF